MREIEKLNKKIECIRRKLDRIKWNCAHPRYNGLMEDLEQARASKKILVEGKRNE